MNTPSKYDLFVAAQKERERIAKEVIAISTPGSLPTFAIYDGYVAVGNGSGRGNLHVTPDAAQAIVDGLRAIFGLR